MKLFSDCSGECCLCGVGRGCVAGHGDDDFYPATKEQIIERLDKGQYPSYRQMMIDHLKCAFNYDYHGYIDTDNCVKIDPKEEINKRFGNPFLDGFQQNDGLCCHDKSKEDNMKLFTENDILELMKEFEAGDKVNITFVAVDDSLEPITMIRKQFELCGGLVGYIYSLVFNNVAVLTVDYLISQQFAAGFIASSVNYILQKLEKYNEEKEKKENGKLS